MKLRTGKIKIGGCILTLGNRFDDNVKVIYANVTLWERGPLISESVRESVVCSENVKKLDSTREKGSDSVIQPSVIYGSCRITMDHFVNDLSRVTEDCKPGDSYCICEFKTLKGEKYINKHSFFNSIQLN